MHKGQEPGRKERKPGRRERRRLEPDRMPVRMDCRNCIRKEQPERCKR